MSMFREYDIRGIADTELTNEKVWSIGAAFGKLIRDAGDKNCYVGQDVRLSSPRLLRALCSGLEFSGIKVQALAPGPSPLLYFAATLNDPSFNTASGVMITGSHNPSEYNGFKIVVNGETLHGDDIQKVASLAQKFLTEVPSAHEVLGAEREQLDLSERYIEYLKNNLRPFKQKIKVVLDAGNGAAGDLAVRTFTALGCDVIPLFCDADGTFPNHHPDPTVHKNLKDLIRVVKESSADVGIGFDGDGDRIGAVTASGRIMAGDSLVLYFAREILKDIPNATIISEVKSSQVLYDELAVMGAKPIVWKTGHSLIKAKLKETRAALAGEMSGHMFFAHRYLGFDDAIYAGARLVEALSERHPETLDDFMSSLPQVFNTPELRIDCPDHVKFEVVNSFVTQAKLDKGDEVLDIDGARVRFEDGGWGLLRASNTQPVLVMRFESKTLKGMQHIRDYFETTLHKIDSSIKVPQV
jgi:phosphomannomutase / phosphoglucomutase